jgi:hypothetical protein
MIFRFAVFAIILVSLGVPARGRQSDDGTDFLALHRAYLAKIKSFSGKMTKFEVEAGKRTPVVTQDYWRRSDWVRCRSSEYGRPVVDWLRREGKQFTLSAMETPDKTKIVQGSVRYVRTLKHSFDLWGEAMCVLPYGNYPLDELPQHGYKVVRVRMAPQWDIEWENIDKQSTIRVSLSPDKGFPIRSFEWKQKQALREGKTRIAVAVYEVAEFQEPMPGIFFPSSVISKNTADGSIVAEHISTFNNIVVNKPIPDTRFTLAIPRGTHISDGIRSESYPVDENWVKMGASKPVLPSPKPAPPETPPQTVTPPEPTFPWWGWPLLALLFASLIGGAIYWRRRQK